MTTAAPAAAIALMVVSFARVSAEIVTSTAGTRNRKLGPGRVSASTTAAAWNTIAAPKSIARSFECRRNSAAANKAADRPVSHIAEIDGEGYATQFASLRKRASQDTAKPPIAANRIVANVVSTPKVIAR